MALQRSLDAADRLLRSVVGGPVSYVRDPFSTTPSGRKRLASEGDRAAGLLALVRARRERCPTCLESLGRLFRTDAPDELFCPDCGWSSRQLTVRQQLLL